MTKAEAIENLNEPGMRELMGPNSREWIKAQFAEAAQPTLSTLLFRLRETCRKREAAFKSTGSLTPDEKQWTTGILQELEETVARLKALLDASPTMASEEERRKVIVHHLKNKQKFRQIQGR